MATKKPAIPNLAKTTCLRPLPESMDLFLPLWDKRNAVTLQKDRAIEMAFAAAARKDHAAHAIHVAQAEALQIEEEALSREMQPLQYKAWERTDPNVVTNLGRNDILDKYWRSAGYTQTVVMGLKTTGAPAAGDTQASHAGWIECGRRQHADLHRQPQGGDDGCRGIAIQREPAAELRDHEHGHRLGLVHEQRRQRNEGRHDGRSCECGQLHRR